MPTGVKWQPNDNPSNYNPGSGAFSGDHQAFLDIGNDADYSHSANVMKIYVHKNDTITLTIHNAGPACHAASGGGVVGPDYADNSSSLGPTTYFTMLDSGKIPFGSIKTVDHGVCGDTALSFRASDCNLITDESQRPENYDGYCFLNAWVLLNDSIQGENSFTIESNSGNLIGLSGELTGYGFRTINLCDASCGGQSKANHWSSQTIFSVDQTCTNTTNGTQVATTSGPVVYADADATNSNWNPNLNILLQKKTSKSGGSWTTIGKLGSKSDNGVVTMYNGQFDSGHLYRVLLLNVGVRNTIFIGLQAPGLSQIAAKYTMQPSDCGSAYCTVTPVTAKINDGTSQLLTVTGHMNPSTSKWPSTYWLKRTGPTYKNITNPGDSTGYDTVTPPPDTSTTYTYVVWDTDPANNIDAQVPGTSSCTSTITTIGTLAASCTATADNQNPGVGSAVTITVDLHNNGSGDWPSGFQLIQEYPGGNPGSPKNLGRFPSGSSAALKFNISARSSPQTVTFKYVLHNLSGTVVTKDPLCTTAVTWGTSHIQAYCNKTTITVPKTSATYQLHHPADTYYTQQPPDNYKMFNYSDTDSSTWYYANPPPRNGGVGSPPNDWTYTVPAYYDNPKTITHIPIKITISGTGTGGDYYTTVPNDGSSHDIGSVFDMYGNTWPHIGDYSVTLEYVSGGNSQNYQDDPNNPSAGYGDYSHSGGGQSAPGTCLSWSCGSATPPDGEPGSNQKFAYSFTFDNQSDLGGGRANLRNSSGYHFLGYTTGGVSAPSGNLSVNASSLGGGSHSYAVSFTSLWLYSGTYGINFYFNNQLMAGCGASATATPATRPYFQVPNGSIATGGAFRAVSTSCASSASGNPPYITPVNTNQYVGGVRAFYYAPNSSRLTGSLGSKVQYYGDVLGSIYYNNGSYIGFASTPQNAGPTLGAIAATPTHAGNGGYLNTNSQSHCVNDLYTNTQYNVGSMPGNNINGLASGQYRLPGTGTAIFNGGTVPVGKQITVYYDGNVIIKGNVGYAASGWNATQPDTIPYFMLIVRGNVTVDPSVTQLDGVYVAQPKTNGGGGYFYTCDPNGAHFCTKQLTVNGAVIAQSVRLARAHGTLGVGVVSPEVAAQPAEIFNYSPLMVLGIPNIAQTQTPPPYLEGLFSLPPVF